MKFSHYLQEAVKPLLTDKSKIHNFLYVNFIRSNSITIHDNGVVDVADNINLSNCDLTELPIQFGNVTGRFDISSNKKLKSLRGCPRIVNGAFNANNTSITSLDYTPEECSSFSISDNKNLTSLKGIEKLNRCASFYITNTNIDGLEFLQSKEASLLSICYNPRVTSLHNIHIKCPNLENLYISPKFIKREVLGLLMLKQLKQLKVLDDEMNAAIPNKSVWAKIVLKYIGKKFDRQNVVECQRELIDADLSEYAKL